MFFSFSMAAGVFLPQKPTLTLIADAGSSKTDWVMAMPGGAVSVTGRGLNPLTMKPSFVCRELKAVLNKLPAKPSRIFYYGAGCKNDAGKKLMTSCFAQVVEAKVEVESDILAAARAVCRHSEGIIIAIGTGSHAALYDGKDIIDDKPSLGYLMGDEAGASWLGKNLIRLAACRRLPDTLLAEFRLRFSRPMDEIIAAIYRAADSAKQLGHYGRFVIDNGRHPVFADLIRQGLHALIEFRLVGYPTELPVYACGSVAWALKNELREALAAHHFSLAMVAKSPMEGLTAFHLPPSGEI